MILIGQVIHLIDVPPPASSPFSILIQYLGLLKSNLPSLVPPQKQNIISLPLLLPIFTGSDSFYVISMFPLRHHQHYGVTMFPLYLWLIIQFFMLAPNTLKLIITLFRKKFFAKTSPSVTSLPTTNLLIFSQSHSYLLHSFTFETNY